MQAHETRKRSRRHMVRPSLMTHPLATHPTHPLAAPTHSDPTPAAPRGLSHACAFRLNLGDHFPCFFSCLHIPVHLSLDADLQGPDGMHLRHSYLVSDDLYDFHPGLPMGDVKCCSWTVSREPQPAHSVDPASLDTHRGRKVRSRLVPFIRIQTRLAA